MLQGNFNTKILGLSNVCVKEVQESEGKLRIEITTEKKKQICPCCGKETSYIHDYRLQIIKGLRIRREEVYLFLKKRRYVCKSCGKRFMEKYEFLPRYAHCTKDVYASILISLKEERTVKDIAKGHNVSPTTVERILDKVHPFHPKRTVFFVLIAVYIRKTLLTVRLAQCRRALQIYPRNFLQKNAEHL